MEFNAVQVTKGEDDTGGHKEPTEILSCTAVSVPAARPADTTKPESWPLALPVGAAVYCLDSCSAAVPLARSFIRHQTMHWDLGASVTDDACLVVTELVTNAVQHSGSDDVTVSLVQGCTFLWVHVADHGCWRDCVAPPAEQIWEGDAAWPWSPPLPAHTTATAQAPEPVSGPPWPKVSTARAASRATKPSPANWTPSPAISPRPSPPAAACSPAALPHPHRPRPRRGARGRPDRHRPHTARLAGRHPQALEEEPGAHRAGLPHGAAGERRLPDCPPQPRGPRHPRGDPPHQPSRVSEPRQRVVEFRTLNVRRWDRIVQAWMAGDEQELDDARVDQIVDLGSQWGRYEYVTNIGFAA